MPRAEDIERRLEMALSECARLSEENVRLKELLHLQREEATHTNGPALPHSQTSYSIREDSPAALSQEEKIRLFRGLFRGREDVYALRWESRNGRSGYSPACAREWERSDDGSYRLKKDSRNRNYFPLTDEVIRNHLTGNCTIGIYPMLVDESCWFLAADFDKKSWLDDARAFLETGRRMGVPAALERSRSGNGGHVWIFFDQPLPASTARKLGCVILTRTMERRHQLGLDSYDRFFPNQDTMPRGGFGNLIALPLQREPRLKADSVFLDESIQPYEDQWRGVAHFSSTLGDCTGITTENESCRFMTTWIVAYQC